MFKDHPQQEKIQQLMQALKPVSRGMLRWVDEDVWQVYAEDVPYYRNPDRRAHPGCVQYAPTADRPEVVFIHGHSKPSHPLRFELRVKDVTDRGRISYFTVGRRYPVPANVFWSSKQVSAENLLKTMLSDGEKKALSALEQRYRREHLREAADRSRERFKELHGGPPMPDTLSQDGDMEGEPK